MNVNSCPGTKSLPIDHHDYLNFSSNIQPMEYVPVELDPMISSDLSEFYDSRLVFYTAHGGDVIPPRFRDNLIHNYPKNRNVEEELTEVHSLEKDWGANQVAYGVARELGVRGYWRVNIARALMDFGRFPGTTPPGADHLSRFAINYPFSYHLNFEYKKSLLESCYDPISDSLEAATEGKLIKIAFHTYDPFNPVKNRYEGRTMRPATSLLFRSAGFQEQKRMPVGLFDRLYPDILGEFTADRRLAARISLTLEKGGVPVSHNYPYFLPDGSAETRTQVWFFFKFLRKVFNNSHPELEGNLSYQMVWDMLLDTNLRSTDSESLRSYLHMFRRAPAGQEARFEGAQKAYRGIYQFMKVNHEDIIRRFRSSPHRLSSLGVEIRKDVVWRFHDGKNATQPVFGQEGARWKNINKIVGLLAHSIRTYFNKDRIASQVGSAEEFHAPIKKIAL